MIFTSIFSVQNIQKVFATIAILAVVFSPLVQVPFASAAPTTLFSDGFETTPAFPNWTSADNKWQNDSNGPHTGSRLANVNGPSAAFGEILRKATSSVGYEDVALEFWYRYDGLDDGDVIYAEWTADGSTWNIAAQFNGADGVADDVTTWTQSSALLPPAADNAPNFAIRFRSNVNVGNDKFYLDDVSIKALPIPPPAATLSLVKVVSGGTAAPADFTLTATGPTMVSGASGSLNVTGFTVTPGTYTLSETGGPSGYTAGTYSCVVNNTAPVVSNSLTLANGDVATCTITNTFTEAPKQCVISSDTTTLGNDVASIPTFVHPAWTTELSATDADWIWSADAAQTATFTKTFNVDNAPTGSVLRMAVDNSYTATLNGTPLTCDGSGTGNYASPIDTCSAPVSVGINTLEVVAQNFGGPNSADLINPAGFIYELVITGSSCSPVVIPKYTIDGYKWNDIDADGEWDESENGIKGWTIVLTNTETSVATTTVTDTNGKYTFSVPEGSYKVTEVVQSGWEQTMVSGDGADGDACYITVGGESEVSGGSCDFGNHQNSVAACLVKGQNLLTNGSFEEPTVVANSGQWEIFPSVLGWSISTDGLELWRNLMGPASDGVQNAELDGNQSTTINQAVGTVAGNKYKVSFDFAARPGTDEANNLLEIRADGTLLDTLTLDGTGDVTKDWVTYSYEFTATDGSTNISFEDIGTSDKLGTLLDNTAVCLTEDNAEPAPASLTIDKVVTGEGANVNQAFNFNYGWTEASSDASLSASALPLVVSELNAGTYIIEEINLPSQWSLSSIACIDTDENATELVTRGGNAVSINLGVGEHVTCTFTNNYTVGDGGGNDENIIVRKEVTANSDTSKNFAFNASWLENEGPADFYLTAGTEYNSGDLLSGAVYNVYELIEKGSDWNQTGASCVSSDEGREGVISPEEFILNNGETITCTFTNDQDVYQLEGYVWEDTDEDGIFDGDESPLANWGVNAAAEGQTTRETNSDATGYYKFVVPAGTWTITEDLQSGWNATHPNPTQYVVTVPEVPAEEFTMLDSFMQMILPTAHAAVIGAPIDGLNFGNKQIQSNGGGSSSGSRRKKTPDAPVPQVLGEATSTMPVGAPNTGAGGSSRDAALPSLVLALSATRTELRKTK